MVKGFKMFALAASALAFAGAAHATADGDTIAGTIAFGANGANGGQYYNPSMIVAPDQFVYSGSANHDTAAFSGNTLTITDTVAPGANANGWEQTFTDLTNPFTSFALVSDNFSPDITYYGNNGVIIVDWVGTSSDSVTYTATFSFTNAATPAPEPGTLALLGGSVLGLGLFVARRRAAK